MDCSFQSIIEEQYQLAKNANITDTEHMFNHEREAYIKLFLRDKKEEEEELKKQQQMNR